MLRPLAFALLAILTTSSHAWGYASGKVDVFQVNTYGNYTDSALNGGFCFKLTGFNFYFKVKYFDSGEQKNNMLLVQSVILTAHTSGRELKVTYVDWGQDPTCRVSGDTQPAKWLENLQMLN
jgi:hypothetical protein